MATPMFRNQNMFRYGFARIFNCFRRESRPLVGSVLHSHQFVSFLHIKFSRNISSSTKKMLIFNCDNINSSSQQKGQIQIIFGPMFSGKTTELIRRMRRYQIARHKCLIIKYANDVRYDAVNVATHDRQCLSAVSSTTLTGLKDIALNHSVIGIDEGQFFPDTVSFAEEMANKGKIVIVSALDGTFQRKAFGNILQLVPLAESVIKLTAVCMLCFDEASFTKRIGNETQVEIIGGTDKYMAVCRKCYKIESSALQPMNENINEEAVGKSKLG